MVAARSGDTRVRPETPASPERGALGWSGVILVGDVSSSLAHPVVLRRVAFDDEHRRKMGTNALVASSRARA